jgi:hypothetical protein
VTQGGRGAEEQHGALVVVHHGSESSQSLESGRRPGPVPDSPAQLQGAFECFPGGLRFLRGECEPSGQVQRGGLALDVADAAVMGKGLLHQAPCSGHVIPPLLQ